VWEGMGYAPAPFSTEVRMLQYRALKGSMTVEPRNSVRSGIASVEKAFPWIIVSQGGLGVSASLVLFFCPSTFCRDTLKKWIGACKPSLTKAGPRALARLRPRPWSQSVRFTSSSILPS